MRTAVQEVLELADVQRMLEETDAASTYRHCHTACTWLIREIKRAGLFDYNIALCTGAFQGKDHSWLVLEDENDEEIVIDMTVDQFIDVPVPYAGEYTDDYRCDRAIGLYSSPTELIKFIEDLGV